MLVHFFAYPPPPTLTLTMRTRCQPPNAATPRPSPLSRDVGLCQPSHRQRRESEGRESRGTQEVGGPLSTSRKPRYDFRHTSVFAYSSLPHPLLTTPRSSADLANDASSEHPTTTCRDKAQALAGLDRRGHPTMAHRDKASTPAVLDHQRRRRAYEPPEDKPHLAAGYGG